MFKRMVVWSVFYVVLFTLLSWLAGIAFVHIVWWAYGH